MKHGMRGTRVYRIWCWMLGRCRNARGPYGRRGIGVCKRWEEDFSAFLSDMGEPPSPLHSIDRINNAGGYEPGNCRWATRVEQARNTRTNTNLTHDGKTQTLAAWAEETGIAASTICRRLYVSGWPLSRALTQPVVGRLPEPQPWVKAGVSRSSWYRSHGATR